MCIIKQMITSNAYTVRFVVYAFILKVTWLASGVILGDDEV